MTSRTESRAAGAWTAILVLAAGIVAAMPGCGGGVDSGGTGMTTPTLAVGPVSGYGSIVVAGVHYDESGAAVSDEEGQPLDVSSLRLGAMTQIEGSAVVRNGSRLESTAQSIKVIEQVVGPVQAVDAAAGSFTVLGQRVVITPDTAFDTAFAAGLGALAAGDLVAVYGQLDTVGQRVVATRLEPRDASSSFVLRGAVQAYDRAGRRLMLGGLDIGLAGLPDSALPESLVAGSLVRVRLQPAPATGPFTAVTLRRVGLMLEERDNVELEGRVSQYTSARQFSIDGIPVDASNASFPEGTSGLVAGARVEVEGRASAGLIVARTVKVEREDGSDTEAVEIEGLISALDPGAMTFVVRSSVTSVTVSYAGSPRFEGGTAGDLKVDVKVSVKGRLASDRTRIDATTIEIER